MEEAPKYITKRGQPSLEEITGKETKNFKFLMLKEHYDYLEDMAHKQGISVAEYLRRMIALDMPDEAKQESPTQQNSPPNQPNHANKKTDCHASSITVCHFQMETLRFQP